MLNQHCDWEESDVPNGLGLNHLLYPRSAEKHKPHLNSMNGVGICYFWSLYIYLSD